MAIAVAISAVSSGAYPASSGAASVRGPGAASTAFGAMLGGADSDATFSFMSGGLPGSASASTSSATSSASRASSTGSGQKASSASERTPDARSADRDTDGVTGETSESAASEVSDTAVTADNDDDTAATGQEAADSTDTSDEMDVTEDTDLLQGGLMPASLPEMQTVPAPEDSVEMLSAVDADGTDMPELADTPYTDADTDVTADAEAEADISSTADATASAEISDDLAATTTASDADTDAEDVEVPAQTFVAAQGLRGDVHGGQKSTEATADRSQLLQNAENTTVRQTTMAAGGLNTDTNTDTDTGAEGGSVFADDSPDVTMTAADVGEEDVDADVDVTMKSSREAAGSNGRSASASSSVGQSSSAAQNVTSFSAALLAQNSDTLSHLHSSGQPATAQNSTLMNAQLQMSQVAVNSDAVTLDALSLTIASRTQQGLRSFDINMTPPDLGRVQVKLSFDATGTTNAHITADSPKTLHMLQQDAASLARQLADAGVDLSGGGLNFSLRQGNSGHNQTENTSDYGDAGSVTLERVITPQEEDVSSLIPLGFGSDDVRLDIRV